MEFFLVSVASLLLFSSHLIDGLPRSKRYIHGENAIQGEFPSQVLINSTGQPVYCGATIVNENWILTAAHNFYEDMHHLQRFKLVFGEHDLNKDNEGEIMSKIDEVHFYPKFVAKGLHFDVALIKLKTPLNFNDPLQSKIKPACLNLEPMNVTGLKCYGSGWGVIDKDKNTAQVLQKLSLKGPFNHTLCANLLEEAAKRLNASNRVTDTHICMVSEKDPLSGSEHSYGSGGLGDSGGGLWCERNNVQWQVGILYGGINLEGNSPTIYNKVDYYADWIRNTSGYVLPKRCK